MQYLGGKQYIAKKLATVLNPAALAAGVYVEPFVGGASVMCQIDPSVLRIGRDANQALITMWSALSRGWIPPENVSEEEYARAKATQDPSDPMTAFIGFTCSFAGKWFAGYARNATGTNYAATGVRSVLKSDAALKGVHWRQRDYRRAFYAFGAVVYCDPPYAGTTSYGAVGTFNSEEFWDWARNLSRTNPIYVSEYAAPDDFKCILEIQTKLSVRSKAGCEPRIERLFVHRSRA